MAIVYTGPGDGVGDNTAAFNAAVASVCASPSTRTLLMPVGKYRFASPPAPIPCALNLVGEGKAATWLVKDYSAQGGYFLKVVGGADTYGGGSIRDVSIYASPNSTDGIGVWVVAHQDTDPAALSTNPHGLLIDNVQIGRYAPTGQFAYGVYLDGSQNPGAGGTAPGIRQVACRNTSAASCAVASFYLYVAHGTHLDEVDSFSTPTYGIVVDGGSQNTDVWSNTAAVTVVNGSNVRVNGAIVA